MATDCRYVKSESSSVSKNNMTLFYRESKNQIEGHQDKGNNSSQWELGEKLSNQTEALEFKLS